jgi:hypothetical protein
MEGKRSWLVRMETWEGEISEMGEVRTVPWPDRMVMSVEREDPKIDGSVWTINI